MKPGAMRATARHNHGSFQQSCKRCYISASKICYKAYAQSKMSRHKYVWILNVSEVIWFVGTNSIFLDTIS